ncbi:hypothetical protein EDB89DRAFT_1941539 [Lactarius sanguifluus]|nr:hypothetical protein EDB89DRAFT_1941539 [Lactarius sanguifluus]
MELPPSPSSHHFGTRKPGESGLAEWAQKIRALQRQVDADEEEEHRKLEQEIAASRLARVRRSTGYSRISFDPAAAQDVPSPISHHPSAFESESSTDTYRDRAETLQKLVGKSSPLPSTSPPTTTPMSLATFIGGRETGPRLNKHAPQKDVTGPTSFKQRNNSSSMPHPLFGRGGMGTSGLTSRGRGAVSPISDRELHVPIPTGDHGPVTKDESTLSNTEAILTPANGHPQEETSRQLRTNAPSAALKRYIQHVEQVTPPPLIKLSERDNPRPRTMSTPTGTRPMRVAILPPASQSQPRSVSPRAHISHRTPTSEVHQPLPTFGPEPPPSKSPAYTPSKSSSPAFTVTPKKPTVTNASSLAFGVKLPLPSASTPSLPRIESPLSRAAPLTPPHRTPLHPPKEKDPTPSISRLKGRGFVQSMVKVSSVLEAAAAGSATSETGGLGPTKRSSLVADRWKREPSPSAIPPPTATYGRKNVAQRKSWAASEPLKAEDHERERPPRALEQQNIGCSTCAVEAHQTGRSTHAGEQSSKLLEAQHTGRSVRKAPSLPSLSTSSRPSTPPPSSPGGHGIGSSSTMFSYIKPTKTGDDPAIGLSKPHSRPVTPHSHLPSTDLASTQGVDELGHRTGVGSGGNGRRNGGAGFPVPSGRPLVHLTKGRPKPKRASRKHTAEPLHEKDAFRTQTTHASRSSTTSGAARTTTLIPLPSPARDSLLSAVAVRAPGTPSHADSQSLSDTHQPIFKPQIAEQPLSGIKSLGSVALNVQKKPTLVGLAADRVLPSIIISPSQSQKPLPAQPASASPRSPRRQSRIPSTGSRALVMDVAQALQEAHVPETEVPIKSSIAPQQVGHHAPPMEKRESSHDKYTTFMMFPLVEERVLPAGSVSPEPVVEVGETFVDIASQESEMPDVTVSGQKDDIFVEIPHYDEHLPCVALDGFFAPPVEYLPCLNTASISVDVMSVTGATAIGVKGDTGVFYDSEVLAIVHRFKTKTTGLVETSLWSWQGRRSQIGEREERKLRDMARHYGTKLCPVRQSCEPAELVHALGGRLAIRQGTRLHWSAENTTMHQVRWIQGNVLIDEHDLHVSNLCSAFSYCLTLLGTSYVWHGKGSLPEERQAALEYAQSLATEGSSLVELIEQESDDNEFFWMMLGDDGYASADYWKWRPKLATNLPRIWRVDASSDPYLTNVPAFATQSDVASSVYLTDCIWELFVLVGVKARGSRQDIRLALSSAKDLSMRNKVDRPFTPPIHVLILPSKLPLDFRLHFRDLDEEYMNGGSPPDHMNLLVVSEAMSDLEKTRWEKSRLKDLVMLPLGIDPSYLP